MTTFTAAAHFHAWAAQRRSDPKLPADAAKAAAGLRQVRADVRESLRAANSTTEKPDGPRRGRPSLATKNPAALIIPVLSINRPQWLDDIIYGSTATAVGSNNGQLRVRSGDVLIALYRDIISVEKVRQPGMSARTAQEIAKAARHAAHGVESYLDRHSALKVRLIAETALKVETGVPTELTRGVIRTIA